MPSFRPLNSMRPVRLRLGPQALVWYGCAVVLALLTGVTVRGALARAAEAEAAYGRTRPVVVVVRPVEAGATLAAADTEVRRWPRALVADGVLSRAPTGRTALVALVPGEALREERISPTAGSGAVALVGEGQRAVAVPVAVAGLSLRPGDRVDLLGTVAPDGASNAARPGGGPVGDWSDLGVAVAPPEVVAAGATVIRAGRETVVVSVDDADAVDVAAAVLSGPVVLSLRSPGP